VRKVAQTDVGSLAQFSAFAPTGNTSNVATFRGRLDFLRREASPASRCRDSRPQIRGSTP